ncbi:MAG: NAD(P)H-hydrate dehydratase [Rhodobacteraceae bacterium]|nr:NAD(P)H-hydrate dehydratase [Paracoccaceae bacterium]
MTELLTAAQMRAIETAAIESGEVTGLELMERAGRGVVEAVFEEWPELAKTSHKAVVLCGPGNNGGDGFVVARLLHDWGWEVKVFLYGDADKLPPDARVNYERWANTFEVAALDDDHFDGAFEEDSDEALVIDALFGTGLIRPYLAHKHLAMAMNSAQARAKRGGSPKVVAVDVPSGMCADSGKWLGDEQPIDFAGLANLTVSFHGKKLGHELRDGPASCGQIVVKDIGLKRCSGASAPVRPQPVPQGGGENAPTLGSGANLSGFSHIVQMTDLDAAYPVFKGTGYKYTHGHALILSGPATKTGAARLAARAALRIGAGLVTVGAPAVALAEHAAQLNAVMLREVGEAEQLAEVLQDRRINALCLGPGLGLARARRLVEAALAVPAPEPGPLGGEEEDPGSSPGQRSLVLDADALTAFADNPQHLFDLLHKNCVLTPHAGEFARLFPDIAEKLNAPATKGPAYSKVDATREAAARAGCAVLFKGPDTVIAAPDGRCAINSAHYERSAPWLATAGSGDVLAGFITGLLARGFEPMQAAETAAWLHVECALKFGPGLIAEDLPEQLPAVFRDLGV